MSKKLTLENLAPYLAHGLIIISNAIERQQGTRPNTKSGESSMITIFWIALIYAIILDLNE